VGSPPWTFAPLQSASPGPHAVHSASCPASKTTLPLLNFFGPSTQSQASGSVCRQRIPPPPRVTYEVWLPPSRRPPPALPTRQARRSVPGLHPSRLSPHRDWYPSRGPCLLAVSASRLRLPGGLHARLGRLQGLVLATSPFCAGTTSDSGRRYLRGVFPSRACSRSTWRSLLSRRLPPRSQAA